MSCEPEPALAAGAARGRFEGAADGAPAAAMARALALAARAGGRTSPNPMVGAVALDAAGHIVAEGFHRAPGDPHAERELLEDARARGSDLRGATLVCTLEPCVHEGRTGPCAPALAAAGFARVVVATRDPNPLVNGRGLALLTQAGIEVIEGLQRREARRLNEGFERWIATGRPFVHLKMAMLADGTVHRGSGLPREISGPESRRLVHWWRHLSPAVLVGGGTVRADDPQLTVRDMPQSAEAEPWQPRRIVLSSAFDVPPLASALRPDSAGSPRPLVIGVDDALGPAREELRRAGVETASVPRRGPGLDLRAALALIGDLGITGVLVEGGPTLADRMLREGVVDRLSVFVAEKPDGGLGQDCALRWVPPGGIPFTGSGLHEVRCLRVGADGLITGLVLPAAPTRGGDSEHGGSSTTPIL